MARKKPHFMIRLLLQLVSFLLFIVLTVSLLATAVLLDLKALTSSGGVEAVINAFLGTGSSEPSPTAEVPVQSPTNEYLVSLSSYSGDYGIPDDIQIPDDIEIPSDALTDSNILADFIMDIIQESAGDDVNVTHDQVQNFIDNSTVMDYTTNKVSGYVQDALNGTTTTVITADEIMSLLDENQALIEETFEITVTDEMKEEIRTNVTKAIEEEDLNGTIRQEIDNVMQQPIEGTDMTIQDIVELLGQITQTKVILSAVGLCLLLILLLFLANFYKLGKGLTWASFAFMIIGFPLAIVVYAMQNTVILQDLLGSEINSYISLISGLGDLLAPIHYGIAIAGVVMFVGSIVWRILARILPKRKAKKNRKKDKNAPVESSMPPMELDNLAVNVVSVTESDDIVAEIAPDSVPEDIQPMNVEAQPVEATEATEAVETSEIVETIEAGEAVEATETVEATEAAEAAEVVEEPQADEEPAAQI